MPKGITGHVIASGALHGVQGIIMSVYDASSGEYRASAVTDASGDCTIPTPPGSYKVRLYDPAHKYGEYWDHQKANFQNGATTVVSSGVWTGHGMMRMYLGASLSVVTRRAGHPFTRLGNRMVLVQQRDSLDDVQVFEGVTNKSGVKAFPGIAAWNVDYKESAIDPRGWFNSTNATSAWVPLAQGATVTQYIDMALAKPSVNCTVGVPSSKSKVTRGVRFTVSGKLSRSIKKSPKVKIVAQKGSTTRTFFLKVKALSSTSKYSGRIRLSKKGTWKLYAVFKGTSAYAPNDSNPKCKTVVVK
jgi:hypothetical protein